MVPVELLPGERYRHVDTVTAPAAQELLEWLVVLAPRLELEEQVEKVASVAHVEHPAAAARLCPYQDNLDVCGQSYHK